VDNASRIVKGIANRLAEEQYEIFHQHRPKVEAERESRDDDEELRKYLVGIVAMSSGSFYLH